MFVSWGCSAGSGVGVMDIVASNLHVAMLKVWGGFVPGRTEKLCRDGVEVLGGSGRVSKVSYSGCC